MQLEEIAVGLGVQGYYTGEMDEGMLIVRNSDTLSEFIVESFDRSLQIRQAAWFECDKLAESDRNRFYAICSMVNERFSGCKCFIDEWGTLVTAADIIEHDFGLDYVETLLGQVEFISVAISTP
jgi:hypothetical protein